MNLNIYLVHGYTGHAHDLAPLSERLSRESNTYEVINIELPNHLPGGPAPPFDVSGFIDEISHMVSSRTRKDVKNVFIGHSTGACLLVSAIVQTVIRPDLLVLINAPPRVDITALKRWRRHRKNQEAVAFTDVAKMVSLINSLASQKISDTFPVLVISAANDELVPVREAEAWRGRFAGSVRVICLPDGVHHLFRETVHEMTFDTIARALKEMAWEKQTEDDQILARLNQVEPEAGDFLSFRPSAAAALSASPAAIRTLRGIRHSTRPLPVAVNEPVFANIEITTRCNLQCKYCARTLFSRNNKDMLFERFVQTLDLLPNAYRITLVGLGEPLLHKDVVNFVAYGVAEKRRMALVTNAMGLSTQMSKDLISAGLHSIAFSIDGPSQKIASKVRKGTDFKRVLRNIKAFVETALEKPDISKAVFTALSMDNLPVLKDLIDIVADLGVNVLMLSDLNFEENRQRSINYNATAETEAKIREAVTYAFSKKLPVLSVRGIEEYGLAQRYQDFLLLPPSQLFKRSSTHTWCMSPWQTIPVDVDGNVSVCDCQAHHLAGNLFLDPFGKIWNGNAFMSQRKAMLSQNPPAPCKICPRF